MWESSRKKGGRRIIKGDKDTEERETRTPSIRSVQKELRSDAKVPLTGEKTHVGHTVT